LNSYRSSDAITGKPPSGRLQPISRNPMSEYSSSLRERNENIISTADDFYKKKNLPALTYEPPEKEKKKISDDSDDSFNERYKNFTKKVVDHDTLERNRYDEPKINSLSSRFDKIEKKSDQSKHTYDESDDEYKRKSFKKTSSIANKSKKF
jgi:hypothetical protein